MIRHTSNINRLLAIVLLVGYTYVPLLAQSQDYVIKGVVFEDKNENGQWDKGEKTLRNIQVANGRDMTRSDRSGQFMLRGMTGQSIFPIAPASHQVFSPNNRVLNANFFYLDPLINHPDTIMLEIPLVRDKIQNHFSFAAVGDIQVNDHTELGYAAKSIFNELKQRNDLDFQMILGDLVNNETALFSPFNALLRHTGTPSWVLAGNHDRDVSLPAYMDHDFNRMFGTSNYAFNYGEALFVVFNNVHSTGKHGYEGRYSADQMEFLRNLVAGLSDNKLIIINQHIPMSSTRNRDDLIEILSRFEKVLVLSGHTHQIARHFYNDGKIHELVVGAPAGSWWRGEQDHDGIPLALQQCGSPRNYFTIDVSKNDYQIHFKGIGLDAGKQLRLSVENQSKLILNIFGGSLDTKVTVRINGSDWMTLQKTNQPDPMVIQIIEDKRPLPLRRRNSPHIWTLDLDTELLPETSYLIEVKAVDDYGFSIEQSEIIYLLPN